MIRELLSTSWKLIKLINSEFIPILLKNCRDKIYAEANEILNREQPDEWNGETYEKLRSYDQHGYTSVYLQLSANHAEFSTSAKISTMLDLAKLDLQKETTISELVSACCCYFPVKEALQKLVELGKQNEGEGKVVKRIFEFQSQLDSNCLMNIFYMGTKYTTPSGEFGQYRLRAKIAFSFQSISGWLYHWRF